jgi:hypothetical protein
MFMQLITTINERKILHLPLNEGWQNEAPENDWCAFIIADAQNNELATQIAQFFLKNKVSYVCVGGIESKWMHDFIDTYFIGDQKDVYFAMTTWNKSVQEEFWFACYTAFPEEGVIESIVCIDMNTNNADRIQELASMEKTNEGSEQRYEILDGLPQDDSLVIPFGDQPFYSEGFVVRFFNEDGSSWVANFFSGASGEKAVYDYPGKNQTFVFAGGYVYVMNLGKKEVVDRFDGQYHVVLNDEKGRFISYDYTGITVVEPNGEIWKSRRISWDGLENVKAENDTVSGFSGPLNEGGVREPFSLNLITKEVIGGNYRGVKLGESLFSKIKKILKYTFLAIVLVFIFLVFYSSPISKKNAENLKKIQPGMTVGEVVAIMGKPVDIRDTPLYPEYEYTYTSPGGMLRAGNYIVFFYKDSNTVRGVYRGD